MYKSKLLNKDSKFNQSKESKNYDQTLFPRINKKKISVYKILENHSYTPIHATSLYVENTYWQNDYTEEQNF